MSLYAWISIFEVVLKLIIVLLLVLFLYDKLILYSILTLCVVIVIYFVYFFCCRKIFECCHYLFIQDKEILKELLSFSGWSLFGNISVIGAKKDGALLEGSKDFSKQFMQKHGVPTAKYKSFTKENLEAGFTFLETLEPPFVLKADGLAAGKGVLILDSLEEAKS